MQNDELSNLQKSSGNIIQTLGLENSELKTKLSCFESENKKQKEEPK